jgi:hypothetical protein
MTDSRFYRTDPLDPDAPVVQAFHYGPHGRIRPGDRVEYTGPLPLVQQARELIVAELIAFGDLVSAILNDGEYEVSADNLRVIG